jgi:hypothetical protein
LAACNSPRLFSNTPCDVARVAHPRQGKFQSSSNAFCLSMIFSESRLPPRIKSGAGFFGITL